MKKVDKKSECTVRFQELAYVSNNEKLYSQDEFSQFRKNLKELGGKLRKQWRESYAIGRKLSKLVHKKNCRGRCIGEPLDICGCDQSIKHMLFAKCFINSVAESEDDHLLTFHEVEVLAGNSADMSFFNEIHHKNSREEKRRTYFAFMLLYMKKAVDELESNAQILDVLQFWLSDFVNNFNPSNPYAEMLDRVTALEEEYIFIQACRDIVLSYKNHMYDMRSTILIFLFEQFGIVWDNGDEFTY